MSGGPNDSCVSSQAQPGTPATKADEGRRESCVKYFDTLWFCYSPVHQLQEYYRFGQADDCLGHWSKLYACLKKRTKFADQVPEDQMKGKHPLWRLRSKEEAEAFWGREFGHLQHLGGDSGTGVKETGSNPAGVTLQNETTKDKLVA